MGEIGNKGNDRTEIRGVRAALSPAQGALRVSSVYLALSLVWILASDKIVSLLTSDPSLLTTLSVAKGALFVFFTAVLIFILVRRAMAGQAAYSLRLGEGYARLQERCEELHSDRDSLQRSEEQYRTLFNAMLYGYGVHEIEHDASGNPSGVRTLNSNRAYEEIAGSVLPADAGLQGGLFGLLPGEARFWLDGFQEVVSEGRAMHFQIYSDSVRKYLEITVFRPAPFRFATIVNDITARKHMEKALEAESEQLRVTLDSIGDGVISVDTAGMVTMINGVAETLTGWAHAEAQGLPISEVLNDGGGDGAVEAMVRALPEVPEPCQGERTIRARTGMQRVIRYNCAPMRAADGGVLGLVLVFGDVTEQRRREEEILYLSYHDTLTGLYNRSFFEEELKRLDTGRQLPLSVIMGDANNLKLVNDVFGHMEGDGLIKALAKVLQDSCRAEDIISRWGGDEFTILLPCTDAESAALICRRIADRCRAVCVGERRLKPSVSLGYATKAAADTDISHVLKSAEDMMYKNKLLESRLAHNEFLALMRRRMIELETDSEEHIRQLTEICTRVGREMNLTEAELEDLKILAMLHDIGEAAIDPGILRKTGNLTEEDWEQIRRHCGIGYRIVRSAPELVLVADYILGHHERWDGKGYPRGIRGEDIPLPSRIFSVVDAFDVMTRGRPYRMPLNRETALMEVYRCSGGQFDPEVVNAFASVLNTFTDPL